MTTNSDRELLSKYGYKLVSKIGQGAFSMVYRGSNEQPQKAGIYAIKVVKCDEDALHEVTILKKLQENCVESIVKFIESYQTSLHMYIITEYCDKGNLEEFILARHKLAECLVRVAMQQIAVALKCLHSHNICHMDIKPHNILLCSKPRLSFKLSDFGIAKILNSKNLEKCRTHGSLAYMAPEKIIGKPYDLRSDLWSVGIVMFQCLFGRPSYFHSTLDKVKTLMTKENLLKIPPNSHITDCCEDLLKRLLKYKPEERITLKEFYDHTFIDLSSIPNEENYKTLMKIAEDAVVLDKEKKFSEALKKYEETVDLLNPYLETETDIIYKERLESKFHQYMQRINEITLALQKTRTPDATPSCSFDMLMKLASSTPTLVTGLEIGLSAEEYLAEGNRIRAVKKIEEALEVLVPACTAEPNGYRRTLLLAQVNKWLGTAEELKK